MAKLEMQIAKTFEQAFACLKAEKAAAYSCGHVP